MIQLEKGKRSEEKVHSRKSEVSEGVVSNYRFNDSTITQFIGLSNYHIIKSSFTRLHDSTVKQLKKNKKMKTYINIFITLFILTSCQTANKEEKHDDHEKQEQAANGEEAHAHEDEISISQAQFKANHMVLDSLQIYQFSDYIEASGTIDVPPKNKASISPFYGGYVKSINLINGDFVKKGQLLFSLENPDFLQLQQDFLQAKEQLAYLKLDYERQKQLADEQIASKKKYLKAKADYRVTKSKYQSLKRKLIMLHINPDTLTDENIRETIFIYAPISGYVSDISIEKGAFLSPEKVALKITNTKHKHVELKVYEKDYNKLKKGQKVVFSLQNSPKKQYHGTIHLLGKTVDKQQRFINIHVHIEDEKSTQNILPMMYVDAKIAISNHEAKALPETAVIDKEAAHFVLVQTEIEEGNLIFEAKEVVIGDNNNGMVEIINFLDIKPTDKILVKGGYFLLGAGGGHQHDH